MNVQQQQDNNSILSDLSLPRVGGSRGGKEETVNVRSDVRSYDPQISVFRGDSGAVEPLQPHSLNKLDTNDPRDLDSCLHWSVDTSSFATRELTHNQSEVIKDLNVSGLSSNEDLLLSSSPSAINDVRRKKKPRKITPTRSIDNLQQGMIINEQSSSTEVLNAPVVTDTVPTERLVADVKGSEIPAVQTEVVAKKVKPPVKRRTPKKIAAPESSLIVSVLSDTVSTGDDEVDIGCFPWPKRTEKTVDVDEVKNSEKKLIVESNLTSICDTSVGDIKIDDIGGRREVAHATTRGEEESSCIVTNEDIVTMIDVTVSDIQTELNVTDVTTDVAVTTSDDSAVGFTSGDVSTTRDDALEDLITKNDADRCDELLEDIVTCDITRSDVTCDITRSDADVSSTRDDALEDIVTCDVTREDETNDLHDDEGCSVSHTISDTSLTS